MPAPMPYREQKQAEVLKLHNAGMSGKDIAVTLGLGQATVSRWINPRTAQAEKVYQQQRSEKRAADARSERGELEKQRDKLLREAEKLQARIDRLDERLRADGHAPRASVDEQQILELREQGLSQAEIAKQLGIGLSTVRRYLFPEVRAAHNAYEKSRGTPGL